MKKITILDFSTAIVYIRELPANLENSQEEDIIAHFEKELDIQASDCEYMIGDLIIDNQ